MKYILLFLVIIFVPKLEAQEYSAQDMTIQLDENGEATITPEDVLVNTTGDMWVLDSAFRLKEYEFDLEAGSLTFVEEHEFQCLGSAFTYSFDRNPIKGKIYASGSVLDVGELFAPTNPLDTCVEEGSINTLSGEFTPCSFYVEPPLLFSFDRDGVLYETGFNSSNDLTIFDINSNIRSSFVQGVALDVSESGLTYDFDNHRLIASRPSSGNIEFIGIDIETQMIETILSIPEQNDCNSNAIEYIGDDILFVGSSNSTCFDFYTLNLVNGQITVVSDQGKFVDELLFLEADIPDAVLSVSEFNCNDVGENIVDITVLENGNPVNYQATVNVVSDFSIRNCPGYRRISQPDPNGSDGAIVNDYTTSLEVVSSCSSNFTFTQDPAPGTLIPFGTLVTITITVTDEFNNTASCNILACSDSVLGVDDLGTTAGDLVLYPNPVEEMVAFDNTKNLWIQDVTISDLNGRTIKVIPIEDNEGTVTLSMVNYQEGIYFLNIATERGNAIKKVIKK
ncbi:MAG: T9SS type A sorting domain-containing protein [Bacteroidota bacterium]